MIMINENKKLAKIIKKPQRSCGICLGASTISAVELIKKGNGKKSVSGNGLFIKKVIRKPHEGNPKAVFNEVLEELKINDTPILVTGRKFCNFLNIKSISEPETVEYALKYISGQGGNNKKRYNAVVSAGGETFMVYLLNDKQQISTILTGNKCASGTGEFYMQQIKRMNLNLSDSIKLAGKGVAYAVSGRCSVFCKSDCTHALNKGQPVADITAGLCKMIANKISELLCKNKTDNILLVGGTALNNVIVAKLKEDIKNIYVPKEAAYFEALGAALAAFRQGISIPPQIFKKAHSHFSFLAPLKDWQHLVEFKTLEIDKPRSGDECIIGLDVGSTTTKAILMRLEDNKILGKVYLRTNGDPVQASKNCYSTILKELNSVKIDIVGIGITGSGRYIAGLYSLSQGIINEIIAHAAAAVYFDTDVDTIFEIGGQDAKYTYITNTVASDYAMNEACSAGTGSFLEESAFESLNIQVKDIAERALKAVRPPNFSDQCAAFISSDIKNAIHEAISHDDILAGLVYSICFNYVNRVKGKRPIGKKVFMQGGVCYNKAVPVAMASILKIPIIVPPEPGLMGAFGVALEMKKRLKAGILKMKKYDLREIIKRKIIYKKPFICNGGKEKCDLKCQINRIKLNNRIYLFGGACNRYYNILNHKKIDEHDLDYVDKRNNLMFHKYSINFQNKQKPNKKPLKIGLCTSLITNRLFPIYYNFFKNLGCEIILPQGFNEKALNRQTASMCYPAEIALGLFANLLEYNPDYIFMPHIRELYVPNGIKRKDFCATCLLVQGEAFWMRQAFKDMRSSIEIISPTIDFNGGWENGRKAFLKVAKALSFKANNANAAFQIAIKAQEDFENACFKMGEELLVSLKKNPDLTVIVLFGRPYNAYNALANKGLPKKFTSRGVMIIPFEMLPYYKEPLSAEYEDYMHWEAGQRILRAAKIVKDNKQLFAVFLTNFLCAPDSFLVSYFRRIMDTKPSLTLEVDAHTADAGINTRIEAFLDIIKNYRNIKNNKGRALFGKYYRLAKIITDKKRTYFLDSDKKRFSIKDPKVKLILPSMGDLASKALAHAIRRFGINAITLPIPDQVVLRLGRAVTTGKECLPLIICIGSLLKYLKQRKDINEKLIMILPKAGGYCRLGQYNTYTKQVLNDLKIKDVALLTPAMEENYFLFDPLITLWAWKVCVISDVMDDIRNVIQAAAVDKPRAINIFYKEYDKICCSLSDKKGISLYKQLKSSAAVLKKIKLKTHLKNCPVVAVTGEIFVRREAFSNLGIVKRLTDKGFVVINAPVIEWFYYVNYLIKQGLIEPKHTVIDWIIFFISNILMRRLEKKIKRILAQSGLYEYRIIDIPDIIKYVLHLTPRHLDGEHHLIGGTLLKETLSHYCGLINIGPFGCMQVRLGQSIFSQETDVKSKKKAFNRLGESFDIMDFKDSDQVPFLTIESDGNPYPQLLEARFENFCIQAARIAKRQGKDTSLLTL